MTSRVLKTEGLFCRVSLKEVKAFLPRLNYKIPTNKLREIFNDVDTRKRGEIGFDDFTVLYHKIIFDENVSSRVFTFRIVCQQTVQLSVAGIFEISNL